jgi:hypothetical protein
MALGLKKEEVTGGWRKLQYGEVHSFYSQSYIKVWLNKEEKCGLRKTHVVGTCTKSFFGKLSERQQL